MEAVISSIMALIIIISKLISRNLLKSNWNRGKKLWALSKSTKQNAGNIKACFRYFKIEFSLLTTLILIQI